jgi:hypothetical protein
MSTQAELEAAINETLDLADSLNEAAIQGAGFGEHWGERVMQAVRPLRNVEAFAGSTLEHNRLLLEHNGKLIDQLRAKDAEIERLKRYWDMAEHSVQSWTDTANKVLAENAALRRELDEARGKLNARATLVSDTCVYLSDRTKVVVKRDGKRAWLEVVPQDIIQAAKKD